MNFFVILIGGFIAFTAIVSKINFSQSIDFIQSWFLQDSKLLSIEKVEIDIDPEFVKASAKLHPVDGLNVVDIDIEVIKEQTDVEFQATIYRHNVDHFEHYYKSVMESGCTRDAFKDPILIFLMKESKKHGNITEACPLKVGHYQIRNFNVDTDDMPHQVPVGSYRFEFTAFVKKAGANHDIYTEKYYVSI